MAIIEEIFNKNDINTRGNSRLTGQLSAIFVVRNSTSGKPQKIMDFSHQMPGQPRWLSGLRRGRVHSLVIARRSLCPEKLGSNPGRGSKGINFSGWHGLDMSITVTKRR